MRISGAHTSVVMATNNGYGGQALNASMAGAVKNLSSNESLSGIDNNSMAQAMNALMPQTAISAVSRTQEGIQTQMTPGIDTSHDKGR